MNDACRLQYDGSDLKLLEDRVIDRLGTRTLDDFPDPQPECPVRLIGGTPILERLWRVALSDIESNVRKTDQGVYFAGGANFRAMVYTRDISYSGVLGLNRFYPRIMRDSLDVTRCVRWDAGFTVSRGHAVPEVDAPWEELDIPESEFSARFNTNTYSRRTDDVVWLWAAQDLLQRMQAGESDWSWLYVNGQRFFERFYQPFFDPSDGLYRGQVSFVDVRWPHKPHAGGYPSHFTVADCLLLKASTTNALYLKGLRVMADAAQRLGREPEAQQWTERAERLQTAIGEHLVGPDGRIVCYKDRQGAPSAHKDALGTALCILQGAVDPETAVRSVRAYPKTGIGIPLFDPFFPHDRRYHNLASWPFVDAFFLAATEKALGESQAAYNLALLARVVQADGFHELVDMRDGSIAGSGRQLWSAAAYLDACRRAGLEWR